MREKIKEHKYFQLGIMILVVVLGSICLLAVVLNLDAAGYPIVFHVHDEAVMEMPIGEGSMEDACAVMGQPPDWASDLPLRADGYECAYYRKD